eukprot:TRINITY_DN122586_c0_g1_i1.p1 TRINITY_DN122586_c0_g1~~TRINITY_DN122586_c0_g1_i1.p1  ORF type:complete len:297 (+),score=74.93 TRINITY_DN122586_c0_g1_i1:87-977(+)
MKALRRCAAPSLSKAASRRTAASLAGPQANRVVPPAFWRDYHRRTRKDDLEARFRDELAQHSVATLMPAQEAAKLEARRRRDTEALVAAGQLAAVDVLVQRALDDGLTQVVSIGTGLDCRAYRLQWPAGAKLLEVDEAVVHDVKLQLLAGVEGLRPPGCELERIVAPYAFTTLAADMPVEALRGALDVDAPSMFLIDGSLGVWPSNVRASAAKEAHALSSAGSRLVAQVHAPGPPEAQSFPPGAGAPMVADAFATVLQEIGWKNIDILGKDEVSKMVGPDGAPPSHEAVLVVCSRP